MFSTGSMFIAMHWTFLSFFLSRLQSLILSTVAASIVVVFIVTFIVLCIFSYWKRGWFFSDRGQRNPYKMVFMVLNFARKHKHPLLRSAFTYCDDERPSRLDFCKERFGGPFTTEQVEDVKTFFKILMVFLCIGPVFVMDFPASYVVVYIFEAHLGAPIEFNWISIVVNGGVASNAISTIFLPIYIYGSFSL